MKNRCCFGDHQRRDHVSAHARDREAHSLKLLHAPLLQHMVNLLRSPQALQRQHQHQDKDIKLFHGREVNTVLL